MWKKLRPLAPLQGQHVELDHVPHVVQKGPQDWQIFILYQNQTLEHTLLLYDDIKLIVSCCAISSPACWKSWERTVSKKVKSSIRWSALCDVKDSGSFLSHARSASAGVRWSFAGSTSCACKSWGLRSNDPLEIYDASFSDVKMRYYIVSFCSHAASLSAAACWSFAGSTSCACKSWGLRSNDPLKAMMLHCVMWKWDII